jgi:GrpB-like predicted nucleotidyltransferase (UPF0157 family)
LSSASKGRTAGHTGSSTIKFALLCEDNFAAAGNMLANADVVPGMMDFWRISDLPFAERLIKILARRSDQGALPAALISVAGSALVHDRGTGRWMSGNTEPMSDGSQPEFLQPPVRADGPIRLADPDPEWAAQYARQRERIQSALGPRAVQVVHVGSTSVPGLAAKLVIDIVLVVTNSADEAGYLPDLETAGYVLQFREPDWYEHRFLRDHNPEVQVHVFTLGSPEVERMLLFRDRLRCRSDERELY